MNNNVLIVMALVFLTACGQTGTLYPANKQAEKIGPLNIQFTKYGLGAGPVQIAMPSGETLNGEFRVQDNSVFGYGTASTTASGSAVSTGHTSVSGPGEVATANSVGSAHATAHATTNSFNQSTPGSRNGMCAFVGDKGTNGSCDFFVNAITSTGAGNCKFSNGAEYNLMF